MNANRAGCIILLFVGIVAWVAFVPITNEDRVGIAALDALVTETTFIHSNHEFNDNGTNPPTVSSVAKRRLPRQQSASWSPSAALRAFEGTCLNELPALFESSRLKKTVLWTSMKQWVMYEPRTVCVTPEAHVLYFSSESGGGLPNRMFERHIRGDRNTRVDYEAPRAMFNGNLSLLLHALKAAQTNGSLSWHNSLGVIMASRLDQHPYHFLLDEALQALSVLTNPDDPISSNPFEPIRISDALLSVVRKDDDDRPMWPVTLAMVPPLMMMPLANVSFNDEKRQLVMIDGNGASDGKTHCYCQAVVLHGHYQRDRRRFERPNACAVHPEDAPCQMFLVLRKRLQRHFGLVPFGETAPLASFQRFGFWPNVTNVSTPRLLMGLRNVRFLAQANEIEAMARELGFATQRIYFEEHSYEAQFTAMRSADVFLSVHGAALTWLLFLDTLGPNAFCRSVIEMMVTLPERYIPFYIHEATLSNVSHFRVRKPEVTLFNVSKRERAILESKRNPFRMMLKSQSLSYDLEAVKVTLHEAAQRRRLCAS